MKTISKGIRNSTKILIAYVLGQITQIIIHAVELSFNMWATKQIGFAAAAGFLIFFAVFMGVRISAKETAEAHKEYTYYAEGGNGKN